MRNGVALPGLRFDRAVALVDALHRQAEAAGELAGEALGAPGVVMRGAVGVKGDADHQRVRAPFVDQRADGGEAGVAFAIERAQRRCRTQEVVAAGNADAPGAEIKSQVGTRQSERQRRRRIRRDTQTAGPHAHA